MEIIAAVGVFFVSFFIAFLARVTADDFIAWTPWWVSFIIRIAVSKLEDEDRIRFSEEWQSDVNQVPGTIGKLFKAMSCIIAAYEIACARKRVRPLWERIPFLRLKTRAIVGCLLCGAVIGLIPNSIGLLIKFIIAVGLWMLTTWLFLEPPNERTRREDRKDHKDQYHD